MSELFEANAGTPEVCGGVEYMLSEEKDAYVPVAFDALKTDNDELVVFLGKKETYEFYLMIKSTTSFKLASIRFTLEVTNEEP